MPKLSAGDLDKLYRDADEVDKEWFAECRSNILLVSGDHYQRKHSKFINRIRKSENIPEETKLRLTKNHIKRIVNEYEINILSSAPTTKVFPLNNGEVQDQKTAELNNSVLEYHKKRTSFDEKLIDEVSDFVSFGEVWSITQYDPDKGDVVSFEPMVDEMGQPILDEMGQPMQDQSKPVMEGELNDERILAFDILRAPEANDFRESPYIIRRKMIANKELKKMLPNADDYSRAVNKTEETYHVFDHEKGKMQTAENMTMVREHYYRPSKEYPRGYYYIATSSYIISEGELPFGKWPLVYKLFDKVPTSCRGRSPIKQMRPYQIEINRSASAMATAQITTGDDKIIMNAGGKIAHGGQVPGVRGIVANGSLADMKIIPGRTGEQYLAYMNSQISEMYSVMNVQDLDIVNDEGKLDPYAMLFRSTKNKKRFSKYTKNFEDYVISKTSLYLDLAKEYLDENTIIPIVGRQEQVNIAEFKHSDKNKYRIKVESIGTDAETMLGKQIAINHTLQYVGANLQKEELGKLLRAMPYLNEEEAFDEFTIDYDNSKNDMLALERGEMPPVNRDDNHTYAIKRLVTRMKKPDFRFLDPQIQHNYNLKKQAHELIFSKLQAETLRLEQGLIPIDGYLVKCDFYTTDEKGKTSRVELPYKAVAWLIEQLKAQGSTLEQLKAMQPGTQAEVAGMTADQMSIPRNMEGNDAKGREQRVA